MVSKVHPVPRKQGRRLENIEFCSFWFGIIVSEGATGVYERRYPFNFKREGKRKNYAN